MQIETIQAFLQVCRDGAISKSCEKMNISQQGLSRQLLTMEKELGTTLLHRSRQGIQLTAEGRLILPYFEEIDRQYAASLQMLRQRQAQNIVRLGFSASAAHAVDSNFVIQYQTLHPEILVQISTVTNDDCEKQLLEGNLDAALLVSPQRLDSLDAVLVSESRSCAVLSKTHPLASRSSLSLHDLEGETIFVPNRQFRMRQLFDQVYQEMLPKFKRILSSAEYMDYLKLPAQNPGIALGFDVFCQKLGDDLTVIPMEENFPMRIYFCRNPAHIHPKQTEEFIQYVRDTLKK